MYRYQELNNWANEIQYVPIDSKYDQSDIGCANIPFEQDFAKSNVNIKAEQNRHKEMQKKLKKEHDDEIRKLRKRREMEKRAIKFYSRERALLEKKAKKNW